MSPITINRRIIVEHSVQRETITLALFSTMCCSGLLRSGEKREKRTKNIYKSVPSFVMVDPIFLIGSCALAKPIQMTEQPEGGKKLSGL